MLQTYDTNSAIACGTPKNSGRMKGNFERMEMCLMCLQRGRVLRSCRHLEKSKQANPVSSQANRLRAASVPPVWEANGLQRDQPTTNPTARLPAGHPCPPVPAKPGEPAESSCCSKCLQNGVYDSVCISNGARSASRYVNQDKQ